MAGIDCSIVDADALSGAMAHLVPAASEDLFASRLWFDTLARYAAPEGARAGYAVAGTAMLLPVWQDRSGVISGLTGPYTIAFRPLFPPGADIRHAGAAFAALCRRRPPLRLDSLDPDLPGLQRFIAGLRQGGLTVQRFDHFGNWFETVAGLSFAGYLRSRPGPLRSTIRRKLKAAEGATRFELVRGGAALEAGIAAFEQVYAKSWKEPEPFAAFNAGFMRALAAAGLLRLGVLRDGETPVAAQYWTVSGGVAVLHKLAHDEASLALSPGTVLTAQMIRAALEEDEVVELDFGRGDDPYKQSWVGQRRQRIGLNLIDPRHPSGLLALATAQAGALRRRMRALFGGRAG